MSRAKSADSDSEDRIPGVQQLTNEQRTSLDAGRERVFQALKLGHEGFVRRAKDASISGRGSPSRFDRDR